MMRGLFAIAFVAAFGFPTCSGALGADAPAPRITPERLQEAIAKLEELAVATIQSNGTPGLAIAVVHRDKVIYTKCFGVREMGKPELIDAETVFQVASMSKPITSTVLAALVGEKQIGWDDRVSDHDPTFVMYTPYVTRELRLRDLLCHRSGLPDHAGDLLEDMGYPAAEILRRLRYQPPSSSFRAGYAYNNFGYSEAAYAAAKGIGAKWDALAQEKLFEPLGMKSTSYAFADYAAAKNRAKLHVLVDGKWTAKNTRQPDAQAPAGGVSSTITDLARWMRLQLGDGTFERKELVNAAALAETHTPQIVTGFTPEQGRVASYGLGWNVIDQRGGLIVVNHSGEFGMGVRTEVALIPTEEIGITVLSNGAPNGVPEGLSESFFDWALDGKLQRDWMGFANQQFALMGESELAKTSDFSQPPADRGAPLAPAAYVGKYQNEYFGVIEVAEKGGKLTLGLGPKLAPQAMTHWDRDVYWFQPIGEMAAGRSGVIFSVGAEGRAGSVLVENLDVNGLGRFLRVEE
jgi:CubicO group peptidase (beta-lactamase class C family)